MENFLNVMHVKMKWYVLWRSQAEEYVFIVSELILSFAQCDHAPSYGM